MILLINSNNFFKDLSGYQVTNYKKIFNNSDNQISSKVNRVSISILPTILSPSII